MMSWIARFFVTPVVLLAAASFVPGVVVSSVYTAIIVSILLGFINIFIRPILLIFALPITLLTLGLFVFVLNGLILWFISSFVQGFAFEGFVPAFVTALLIAVAHWFANLLLK